MKRIVCGKGGWLKDAANYGMDYFMGINKGALGTVTGGATNQFFDQAHEKMYKNEDENYQRKHNSVYGYSQAGGAAITGIVSGNPSAMTGVTSGLSMGISNTGARNMENTSVYKKGGIVKYQEGGKVNPYAPTPVNWNGDTKPTTPSNVFTYENNPGYFDNKAAYSDNPAYNEQIRKGVYSGNFGYDPKTGTLHKLDKPVTVPKKTKELANQKGPTDPAELFKNDPELRKKYIQSSTEDAFKNPLMYAPGTIGMAALPIGFGSAYGFAQAAGEAMQGNNKTAALWAGLSALPFAAPALRGIKAGNKFNYKSPIQNTNLNIEEVRSLYHNNYRFLTSNEKELLRKHGVGLPENYKNNKLPPPPSEVHVMPDGSMRNIYNQQPITDYISGSYRPDYIDLRRPPRPSQRYNELLLRDDYSNLVNGVTPRNYPNLTREQNIAEQYLIRTKNGTTTKSNIQEDIAKLEKEGISKEDIDKFIKIKDKTKSSITDGTLSYSDEQLNQHYNLLDKELLPLSDNIDNEIKILSNMKGKLEGNSPLIKDLTRRLEDLHSTKFLRGTFIDDITERGFKPTMKDMSIVTSKGGTKYLLNGEGKVLGNMRIDGNHVGTAAVNREFHGVHEIGKQNQVAEALYRGIHHGINNVHGTPLQSSGHFATTSFINPKTGLLEETKRAQNWWESKIPKGIAKKENNTYTILKTMFPMGLGAAALHQNETSKYAKGGIVRYGEGGKVGEKEKLINAYQLEQAKINANYESVKKYRNQIDKVVQEALSNPDQFNQSFKKNVEGRLIKAGVPEGLIRQCIYTVSTMVNSARSNAGLPLLKGASFQQDGSLGKPMVSNVYTQNEAFKANAVNEGFHITPQGTLPKKGDWIQQGRTFKAKNGTMQQNPFHSVLALDPIINDRGDTLGINSIYNQGHGTIINTGLPKDRFKDEFRVYSYQGENINSTVNTRDSLKNEINKIDPTYFNSKQTPFYNDYNPTSLPINKDLDNDKKIYLESLNANKQEIMKHWNISNSEFDKLADIAFRIPSQESEWGKGIAYNVKGVLPELVQGVKYLKKEDSSEKNVSRGIGSVKIKKILDDPKIKEFFDNLNLTGDQLYNNAYIASNENFPIKTGALLTMTKLVNDYRHTLNDKNFPRNSEERYKESIYKYKGIKHENKTNDYVSSINNSEGIFKGKALNNIEDRKAEGNTTEISPGYNMQWSNENSKAYRQKSEIPVTTNNTNTTVSPILPIEQPIKNPYTMNPVKFKHGGSVNKVQINVEGNELRVDPTNLSVITDYKGLPKHPDNPNFINPQGNVTANEGDVIVPKDMRDRFLNSDYKTKQRMITTLKYRIPETKYGDGGIITDHDKAYDYQRLSNGSWQARKKGSNKWGILKDNQLGDLNTRYPQSNGVPSTLPRVDNGIYSFPDQYGGIPNTSAGNKPTNMGPPGFYGNILTHGVDPTVGPNRSNLPAGWDDKPLGENNTPNSNSFTPMNTKGYQAAAIGSGIASAYSGIDYLLKHRSPYKTTFNRATANHLDPTEAIKGVNSAYGSVNYGLRNLGTAGYLSNRIESGSRQAGDIAKTRMEYDNANAQIDNNFSQFNTQISNSEIEANERNRDTYEMGRKQAMDQIAGAASGATKDAFMYKQEGRKVDYMNQMGLYKVNKKGQIVLRTEED